MLRLPRWVLVVFGGLTVVRFALAPMFEAMPQDTYYVLYAQQLDWSYFDHPPMIGWVLWVSTAIFGSTAFGIRLGMALVALATQIVLFGVARRCLSDRSAADGFALVAAAGIFTVVSLIATPDGPLLLFWALSLLTLHRALFDRPDQWTHWSVAGLAMGAAFLSKYTALFLPAGLGLFLLISRRHRSLLERPGPYVAGLGMAVASLPVVWWNWQHDFASFRFQSSERAADLAFRPDQLLGFLVSQAAMALPVAFALVGLAWWRLARNRPTASETEDREHQLFLVCFSLPLLAFCTGLSTLTWVKVNWPMPAYLAGLLLAGTVVGRRSRRANLALSAALHVLLVVQIVFYPVPVESQDTWVGWQEIGRQAEEVAARHPDHFVFSVDNYKTTSELLFYTDLPAEGRNVLGCRALHLDYRGTDLEALEGRDAIFLRNEPRLRPSGRTEVILDRLAVFFDGVRELDSIEVRRGDRLVRLVRVFAVSGYRGPRAAAELDAARSDDPCDFAHLARLARQTNR